jgi:cytochrome c oxidase subunit 2
VGPLAQAAPRPWELPHDASLYGWRVDWLLDTTSIFVAIMFLVTIAWIVWACWRHGWRHRARYDLGSARAAITKAVLLSLLIFAVVDGNLLIHGLSDIDDVFWNIDRANAHPSAVRIQVNAHQWAWDARYAGRDGKFNTPDDIVTLNDLRVPVGVPVVFQLASTDVIHSLSLPNFRVKQDAVPGTVNRLWFQAKETGQFDIACAQHCGVHHYKMRGQLTVLPPDQYADWAAHASALSARNYDAEDKAAHWGWDWEHGNK